MRAASVRACVRGRGTASMSQIEKPCSNPLECCYQTAGDQNIRITAERSTQQTGYNKAPPPHGQTCPQNLI